MTEFKVAAVFSNHMVLQREKNIKIFGQGKDGETVTVTFLGETYTTTVQQDRWTVILPPQAAGEGYEMKISCAGSEKRFTNIAIGEVWLAGGQSNMEYELQNCTGGKEMLAGDKNPRVRFYYTQKNAYMDDQFFEMEEKTGWNEFGEEAAKDWSAVGYIFGKKLAKDLDVTVGIIGCNWGGTSASNWMSEESLSEDKDISIYLEEYYKGIEGKTEEEQVKEYREYEAFAKEWDAKCAEQYAIKPGLTWDEVQEIIGKCQWPGPKNCMNPYRPGGLYHCMLERVIPYTLRGFLYYQGESDDHRPAMYEKLLTRMIRQWREDWEDLTLPFLLVQLPMHRYKADPDSKNWCLIREAQMNTYQTVKNTGIAVILDCGEYNEIHPKDKAPVGERLELQALYQVYNKINAQEAFGPIYKAFSYKDSAMELNFEHTEKGFLVKGELSGFEIAGEAGEYLPASAAINGSRIIVSSPELKRPVYARYCWTNYGDVTVFGNNGIPLAPFRTHRRF